MYVNVDACGFFLGLECGVPYHWYNVNCQCGSRCVEEIPDGIPNFGLPPTGIPWSLISRDFSFLATFSLTGNAFFVRCPFISFSIATTVHFYIKLRIKFNLSLCE